MISTKPRKPYPRDRQRPKTHFSRAMWARWMAERTDRQTLHLRTGIAEFRRRLEGAP